MLAKLRAPFAILFSTVAVAGCAGTDLFGSGANDVTTSSVSQAAKVDPACQTLAAQIDTLRREGVADRIEKAAAKKYKMTPADLAKADQLTKANADFQGKCSTLPKTAAAAPAAAPAGVSTTVASGVTQAR